MKGFVKAIPNVVIPLPLVGVGVVALLLVWGFMGAIEYTLRRGTVTWEGECADVSWTEEGDIGLKVDCGVKGTVKMSGPSFVRRYMNNPGPVTCRASLAATLDCDRRPEVKED